MHAQRVAVALVEPRQKYDFTSRSNTVEPLDKGRIDLHPCLWRPLRALLGGVLSRDELRADDADWTQRICGCRGHDLAPSGVDERVGRRDAPSERGGHQIDHVLGAECVAYDPPVKQDHRTPVDALLDVPSAAPLPRKASTASSARKGR